MTIPFEEFIQKYTGQPVNTDGVYPNECMDLMHAYCMEVLGLPVDFLAQPQAVMVYTNFDNVKGHEDFTLTANTPTGIPPKGALVFFGKDIGEAGHVCMFIEGDTNRFSSFDSNWPLGFLPHVQEHTYAGVLGWLTFKGTYIYKYKQGDNLEPSIDIPVYPQPNSTSEAYGHIGFKFPATVIGVENGYYNIDQTAIGGGTGWVDALSVDKTSMFIGSSQPEAPKSTEVPQTQSNPSIPMYTQDQYDAIQLQRDVALKEAKDVNEQLVEANTSLSAFKAVGIERVEDITKLKSDYDTTVKGLNTELLQVLQRNEKLAGIVGTKENEDFTAIEEGMKAAEEASQLKNQFSELAKHVGSKPTFKDVLQKVWDIMTLAERAKNQAQVESAKANSVPNPTPTETIPVQVQTAKGIDWLMKFLGLQKGGVVN